MLSYFFLISSFFASFLIARACLGMGSMARDEMCPFSDLEFAFVLRETSEAALVYFRTLTRVVELKVINMGESFFPLFAPIFGETSRDASPTPSGFSMDTGGTICQLIVCLFIYFK
jgi:hypothetical protein